MAVNMEIVSKVNVAGMSIGGTRIVVGGAAVVQDQSGSNAVPAAKVGALSTRTDANTGELTMAEGHGITTGARLDVYWPGGKRYGMEVGTVAGQAVPIDGGAGDDLPALDSDITAMVPIDLDFRVDGGEVNGLVAGSTTRGTIVLVDDDDVELLPIHLADRDSYEWDQDSGIPNPLAGDTVDAVLMSHGDATQAQDMTIIAVHTS